MQDLIERLEKATGPDRELDEAIAVVILTEKARARGGSRKIVGCAYASRFTASIDAALSLVPDGLFWHVAYGRLTPAEPLGAAQIVSRDNYEIIIGEAESATPAIALCIAALKARQAETEKDNG